MPTIAIGTACSRQVPLFSPRFVGFPEGDQIDASEPIRNPSNHRWTRAKCTMDFCEVVISQVSHGENISRVDFASCYVNLALRGRAAACSASSS